jgi:hypothetical protein
MEPDTIDIESSQSSSETDETWGHDLPLGLDSPSMEDPNRRVAAMQIMEQLPQEVDTDMAHSFTEHDASDSSKKRLIQPDTINNILAAYFKQQQPHADEQARITTVVIAGFLKIHMEIELFEFVAFPPRLMKTPYHHLDKMALHMTRDWSLNPPPDTPIQHPYDNHGFRPSHFVPKQHKALKAILSAHTLKYTYGHRPGHHNAWHDVAIPTMAKLMKQYCLVHNMMTEGPEFNETKALLLKTLLRLHMVIEEMPLYTFFNRVRKLPLADLKKQCVALCKMADATTPATARFKPTTGGSED